MQSSTNTLTVRVCSCDREGNMKLCNAEALTARAGLSTGALVAILLCVIILLSEYDVSWFPEERRRAPQTRRSGLKAKFFSHLLSVPSILSCHSIQPNDSVLFLKQCASGSATDSDLEVRPVFSSSLRGSVPSPGRSPLPLQSSTDQDSCATRLKQKHRVKTSVSERPRSVVSVRFLVLKTQAERKTSCFSCCFLRGEWLMATPAGHFKSLLSGRLLGLVADKSR